MLTKVYAVYARGISNVPIALFPVYMAKGSFHYKAHKRSAKELARRMQSWHPGSIIKKQWADLSHCVR